MAKVDKPRFECGGLVECDDCPFHNDSYLCETQKCPTDTETYLSACKLAEEVGL